MPIRSSDTSAGTVGARISPLRILEMQNQENPSSIFMLVGNIKPLLWSSFTQWNHIAGLSVTLKSATHLYLSHDEN